MGTGFQMRKLPPCLQAWEGAAAPLCSPWLPQSHGGVPVLVREDADGPWSVPLGPISSVCIPPPAPISILVPLQQVMGGSEVQANLTGALQACSSAHAPRNLMPRG